VYNSILQFALFTCYVQSSSRPRWTKIIQKLGFTCRLSCQCPKFVHFGQVQKIKPQYVLAAKNILFLCLVQQLPQSLVLRAIFSSRLGLYDQWMSYFFRSMIVYLTRGASAWYCASWCMQRCAFTLEYIY
jgi:hypothetical protein